MRDGAAFKNKYPDDSQLGKVKALPPKTELKPPVQGISNGLLRKAESRYRHLFETAQEGILFLDGDTDTITDVNPYLLDLLGYPSEELIGRHLSDLGMFGDVPESNAAFKALQNKDYVRYEDLPLQTRDGGIARVEFISNLYDVEGEKVIQCNIRDISRRVRAEKTSQTQLTMLEGAEAKDRVLATLSHALRAPLAEIAATLDLLDLGHDLAEVVEPAKIPVEFNHSGFTLIRRNATALSQLVTNLLDLSHYANAPMWLEREVIDAHEVVSKVLREFRCERESKRITLDVRLNAWGHFISADALKFHQILTNLISNAVKFTPERGNIDVASYNTSANQLVLLVHDNGVGIRAEDLPRIFSAFESATPPAGRQFGGLGLGLSLSKSLVEAQGGKIAATSPGPNCGATFSLEFPITERHAPKTTQLALRILLVEDHPDSLGLFRQLLESKGHRVRCAETAGGALELSNREDFDLLIADLGLPDASGLELCRELKQRRPNLEAIAISGYGLPHDFLICKEAGFREHLLKPVNVGELDSAIASAMEVIKSRT